MRYKTRKGIVLTSVCDQYILVAAKKGRENCPYITQINETAACCWEMLMKGCTDEDLIRNLLDTYEVEDSTLVRNDVSSLLDHLMETGYVIIEEEEKEDYDEK